MKHAYITSLLAILLMLVFAIPGLQAQEHQKLDKTQAELLFNAKMKMMQDKLKLSNEQTELLIPIYQNYLNGLDAIFKSRKYSRRYKPETATEASNVMIEHLDIDAQVIELQKKYIVEFAKILTPDQVMNIYRVENEIQREIWKEKKRRRADTPNGQAWHPCPDLPQCPYPSEMII